MNVTNTANVLRSAGTFSHYARNVQSDCNFNGVRTTGAVWQKIGLLSDIITGNYFADCIVDSTLDKVTVFVNGLPSEEQLRAVKDAQKQFLKDAIVNALVKAIPQDKFVVKGLDTAATTGAKIVELVSSTAQTAGSLLSTTATTSVNLISAATSYVNPMSLINRAPTNLIEAPIVETEVTTEEIPVSSSDVSPLSAQIISADISIEGVDIDAQELPSTTLEEQASWGSWIYSTSAAIVKDLAFHGAVGGLAYAHMLAVDACAEAIATHLLEQMNAAGATIGGIGVRWSLKRFIARPVANHVMINIAESLCVNAGYVSPIDLTTKIVLTAVPAACAAAPVAYSLAKTYFTRRSDSEERSEIEGICKNVFSCFASKLPFESDEITREQIGEAFSKNFADYLMMHKYHPTSEHLRGVMLSGARCVQRFSR